MSTQRGTFSAPTLAIAAALVCGVNVVQTAADFERERRAGRAEQGTKGVWLGRVVGQRTRPNRHTEKGGTPLHRHIWGGRKSRHTEQWHMHAHMGHLPSSGGGRAPNTRPDLVTYKLSEQSTPPI